MVRIYRKIMEFLLNQLVCRLILVILWPKLSNNRFSLTKSTFFVKSVRCVELIYVYLWSIRLKIVIFQSINLDQFHDVVFLIFITFFDWGPIFIVRIFKFNVTFTFSPILFTIFSKNVLWIFSLLILWQLWIVNNWWILWLL